MAPLQVPIEAAWLTPATATAFASALEYQLASPKLHRAWRRLREDKPLEFITCCLMEAVPRALAELSQRYFMHALKLSWSEARGFRLALTGVPAISKDELQAMVDTVLASHFIEEEHRLRTPARDYTPLADEVLEVVYGTSGDVGRMVQPVDVRKWGFIGRTPHGYRSYRWEQVKAARQVRHPGYMTDLPVVTVTLLGVGKSSHFTCDVVLEGTYAFGG